MHPFKHSIGLAIDFHEFYEVARIARPFQKGDFGFVEDAASASARNALDWPRRARARQVDIRAAIGAMERPESHRRYYDHASAFAEHSATHARWNREERLPICIGFMTRTIIQARLDGTAVPPELFNMLESMISNGEDDAVAARGFRALLDGQPLPQELATLPDFKRRHLEFIRSVLDEGYIDLDEITHAAVEQRIGVAPLTARHEAYFARPATERNYVWQRCIPFLRAIASGDDVRDLPDIQPEEGRYFLEEALRSVRGERLPVDLEALISAIVWARITNAPLSASNQRRLGVLRSMKPWDAVAEFLVAIAGGSDPEDVQLDSLDEGAISTIQVVRKILGWQEAVRRSVPDALKKATPIDVLLLHHIAVRAMLAFQGNEAEARELTAQLTQLDHAGSPHDAIARTLRTLIATRREPPIPGGIGKDAEWYLRLVVSSALAQEAGRALLEYAFDVTREVLIARRSLTKYELAVFSLLASRSDELECSSAIFLRSFPATSILISRPSMKNIVRRSRTSPRYAHRLRRCPTWILRIRRSHAARATIGPSTFNICARPPVIQTRRAGWRRFS